MRQTLVRVAAIALLASASAFAADLDANEKKWVQQCVDNLVAKSALIRSSAERAISGLGQDALPAVVVAAGKLKTDADWLALSRAIAGMGPGVRKTLDGLRMSWPKGTETRFADMLTFLDKAEAEAKKSGPVAIPASPAEIEAKVMEILETYRGSSSAHWPDPRATKIIALGRNAIGALVKAVCDPRNQGEWALRRTAEHCFVELADESDVPLIGRLAREGHHEFEAGLGRLKSAAAIDLLAELVRGGVFDTELDKSLAPHLRDPAVIAACCAWLKAPVYPGDMDFAIAKMADIVGGGDCLDELPPQLAGLRTQEPFMPEATGPLANLLDRPLRSDARRRVASALVRLGGNAGFPVLIEMLTAAVHDITDTGYERHAAGQQLNKVSGTAIYEGHDVREKGSFTRWEGNFAEAAKAFREWWSQNKDKLRFDAATRTWSVK